MFHSNINSFQVLRWQKVFLYFMGMSKMFKAKRVAQAKKRRKRAKNHLEVLQKLASAPGAPSSIQRKYRVALEQHSKLLKSNRERGES